MWQEHVQDCGFQKQEKYVKSALNISIFYACLSLWCLQIVMHQTHTTKFLEFVDLVYWFCTAVEEILSLQMLLMLHSPTFFIFHCSCF